MKEGIAYLKHIIGKHGPQNNDGIRRLRGAGKGTYSTSYKSEAISYYCTVLPQYNRPG